MHHYSFAQESRSFPPPHMCDISFNPTALAVGGDWHTWDDPSLQRLSEQVDAVHASLRHANAAIADLQRDVGVYFGWCKGESVPRHHLWPWHFFAAGCAAGVLSCLVFSYARTQMATSLRSASA